MPIDLHCQCGQKVAVPESLAGKSGRCPTCGSVMEIPDFSAPAPPPPQPAQQAAMPPSSKLCVYCGESIQAAARKCRHCGEFLEGGPLPPARSRPGGATSSLVNRQIESAATTALVCGIIGLAVCAFVGIVAIVKGNEARRLATQAGSQVPGSATAGLIMGWIGVGLMLIQIPFIFLPLVFMDL